MDGSVDVGWVFTGVRVAVDGCDRYLVFCFACLQSMVVLLEYNLYFLVALCSCDLMDSFYQPNTLQPVTLSPSFFDLQPENAIFMISSFVIGPILIHIGWREGGLDTPLVGF